MKRSADPPTSCPRRQACGRRPPRPVVDTHPARGNGRRAVEVRTMAQVRLGARRTDLEPFFTTKMSARAPVRFVARHWDRAAHGGSLTLTPVLRRLFDDAAGVDDADSSCIKPTNFSRPVPIANGRRAWLSTTSRPSRRCFSACSRSGVSASTLLKRPPCLWSARAPSL